MTLQTAPWRLFLQGGNSNSISVAKVFFWNKPCNYKTLWPINSNNAPWTLTNLWCGESKLYDTVHNSQTWISKWGHYQHFWSSQTLVTKIILPIQKTSKQTGTEHKQSWLQEVFVNIMQHMVIMSIISSRRGGKTLFNC